MPSLILDYNVLNTIVNYFFLTFLSLLLSHGPLTLMFLQYYQPPYHNDKLQWLQPEKTRAINQ
jgi:hypothetical protein